MKLNWFKVATGIYMVALKNTRNKKTASFKAYNLNSGKFTWQLYFKANALSVDSWIFINSFEKLKHAKTVVDAFADTEGYIDIGELEFNTKR